MSTDIDIRKTNSGRFLKEYKTMECLRALPADDDLGSRTGEDTELAKVAGNIVHSSDPLVELGDIRLFSQTERITYGVVLAWDDMRSLVVPLSRYDNPADSTEFFVDNAENQALFMRVYQLWNARTVQKSLLSRTWKVGSISKPGIARLKKMLRHYLLGKELPDTLLMRSGLSDPRLERIIGRYQSEELDNFNALAEENMQIEAALENLPEFDFQPLYHEFETVMAAAGRETLSPVYVRKGKKQWKYLDAIEAENFRRVKAGTALPLFSWFTESILPERCWGVVAFRDANSKTLLGAGVIEPENGGAAIRIRYPVDKQEIPELTSPADIEIIILEP